MNYSTELIDKFLYKSKINDTRILKYKTIEVLRYFYSNRYANELKYNQFSIFLGNNLRFKNKNYFIWAYNSDYDLERFNFIVNEKGQLSRYDETRMQFFDNIFDALDFLDIDIEKSLLMDKNLSPGFQKYIMNSHRYDDNY